MGFGDAMARLLRLPGESVYSKALTIFVGLSLVLGTGVVILTSQIILGEFRETERQEMIATLQRFAIVLSRETRPVEIALFEATDTTRSSGNLQLPQPDELALLQLDFMSVANPAGRITATTFRNPESRSLVLSSQPWTEWIRNVPETRPAGFIIVGRYLTAVAWRKMTDGAIVLAGRILSDEPLAFFEGMFGARVEFIPLQGTQIGMNSNDPLLAMLAKNEFVVQAEGPDKLVGHVLIRGLGGNPLGQIRLQQGRPLYQEGVHAVQVFLIALTFAGGTLFALVWFILDRTILARIGELTRLVEAEQVSGRIPLKLDFRGGDELGDLARRIENLARQLDRAQANYRAVVEDQTEVICRFSPGFAVTFSNAVFRNLFPHNSEKGAFLRECLPSGAFDTLARKFESLRPDHPVDFFVHQISRPGSPAAWFRSTLRATFTGDTPASGQWVAADITAQVETQQKLQESEHQLRLLSSRLLKLRDDERRKIARELHDSTAQSLSALEMNMSLLEPVVGDKHMQRIVAETRQIARDCCLELRNISYLLHPPLLDEVGLSFALQWFVDGFEKRSAISVTLDVAEDFPRLNPEFETTIFRIVQEAMSNIYRHSSATHAWISLGIASGEITLELRDNGRGFPDADGATEGVGFAGMRERLAGLEGKLTIQSSPYGVSVNVRLPHHPTHAGKTG
jgi:signal transduction histidine kinase